MGAVLGTAGIASAQSQASPAMLIPSNNATLSGTEWLDASATAGPTQVTCRDRQGVGEYPRSIRGIWLVGIKPAEYDAEALCQPRVTASPGEPLTSG